MPQQAGSPCAPVLGDFKRAFASTYQNALQHRRLAFLHFVSLLPTTERLHDEYSGAVGDLVRQTLSVADALVSDEDVHVRAKPAAFITNVEGKAGRHRLQFPHYVSSRSGHNSQVSAFEFGEELEQV